MAVRVLFRNLLRLFRSKGPKLMEAEDGIKVRNAIISNFIDYSQEDILNIKYK